MTNDLDPAEAALLREMRLDDAAIERRRRYVGFTDADIERIVAVRDIIEREADRLASGFFEYLSGMPEAKSLFQNQSALQAARQLKHDHLLTMARGDYGAAYVGQRLRLARIYSSVGLDLRVFLGAFEHLLRLIADAIMTRKKSGPTEAFEAAMAVQKVGFFDISLIADVLIHERERVIRRQEEAIREISTPVLQLRERLLLMPLVGIIDTQRARHITQSILSAIRQSRAKAVVIDITGVAAVDSKVANHLIQTVAAARLMGAMVVITGLSPEVAQALVALGVDFSGLNTAGDLQGGIEEAERLLGLRVVTIERGPSGPTRAAGALRS